MTKTEAMDLIDIKCGAARAAYITSAPGQEITYMLKERDARAYLEAGSPYDATPYPLIYSEAQATETTPHNAAQIIVQMAQQWQMIAAAIEGKRIYWKRQISGSLDENVDALLHIALDDLSELFNFGG